MLGSPVASNNAFSDGPSIATAKKRPAAEDTSATANPLTTGLTPANPAISAAAPLPIPVATPAPASNAGASGNSSPLKAPQGDGKSRGSASLFGSLPVLSIPGGAKGELAFGLRLTPLEGVENTSPAPAAPAANPRIMNAGEMPQTSPAIQNTLAAPDASQSVDPQDNQPQQSQSRDNSRGSQQHAFIDSKARSQSDQDLEATPVVTAVSATDQNGADFARQMPNPTPVLTPATARTSEQVQPAAFKTVDEALRASEAVSPEISPVKTGGVQQIAVRVAGPDSTMVDVRVMERAGQVHVSVHTVDAGMQTSLRQDLGTLVNSLERSGYRADAVTTRDAASLTVASSQGAGSSFMDTQSGGQPAGQNPQDSPSHQGSQDGRPQHGASHNGSQQQHSSGGHQQQRRQQYNWIDPEEQL